MRSSLREGVTESNSPRARRFVTARGEETKSPRSLEISNPMVVCLVARRRSALDERPGTRAQCGPELSVNGLNWPISSGSAPRSCPGANSYWQLGSSHSPSGALIFYSPDYVGPSERPIYRGVSVSMPNVRNGSIVVKATRAGCVQRLCSRSAIWRSTS
jgi:hypothetical protein